MSQVLTLMIRVHGGSIWVLGILFFGAVLGVPCELASWLGVFLRRRIDRGRDPGAVS